MKWWESGNPDGATRLPQYLDVYVREQKAIFSHNSCGGNRPLVISGLIYANVSIGFIDRSMAGLIKPSRNYEVRQAIR